MAEEFTVFVKRDFGGAYGVFETTGSDKKETLVKEFKTKKEADDYARLHRPTTRNKPKPKGVPRPVRKRKHSEELAVANPGKLELVQQCNNTVWSYATDDPLEHIELVGFWDTCIGNGVRVDDRIDVKSTHTKPATFAMLHIVEIKGTDAPDRVVTRTLSASPPN